MTTINDVRIGDRVEWFSPREQGTVIDVDYCNVQIRWDDGKTSIERKADGFIGWKLIERKPAAAEAAKLRDQVRL